jgi:hypothetical protein
LGDLEEHCRTPLEIVVVVNLPEDESTFVGRRHAVHVIRNSSCKGFGANHNAAFARTRGDAFVVANPDIRLSTDPFPRLIEIASHPEVGVCAPKVVSSNGTQEDSARRFPTLRGILARRLKPATPLEYEIADQPVSVDWVAGMFVMVRRDVYEHLRGFDPRYFMYFEDVDLCRRVRKMGLDVVVQPHATVVHDARRSSRRHLNHLKWHMQSAARYFLTTADGSM